MLEKLEIRLLVLFKEPNPNPMSECLLGVGEPTVSIEPNSTLDFLLGGPTDIFSEKFILFLYCL